MKYSVCVLLLLLVCVYAVKCPVCEEANIKSKAYITGSTSTMLYSRPYYDEDGKYHYCDPNTHRTAYVCSNGHEFVKEHRDPCNFR